MSGPARRLRVVRVVWGVLLLVAPGAVLPRGSDRSTRVVARILGVRHLVEAALLETHPGRRWQWAGVAVDAIHAATALVTARIARGHERVALANAATASLLAADGARVAAEAPR